ncbi:MAG TPA: sugar ABC transporter permease, partial [Polyangiales bacterium]|nr:sugar ABC transporter permease [Polyangiales bacterium]
GASRYHRFVHVTLPLLTPSLAFVGTTSLILSFQAFDVVRVMTQGGPVRSTTLFVYSVYERLFLDLQVGKASAEAVVFFFVLVLLTGLELWAFGKRERA